MEKVKISEELIREIHADGKWSERIQKEVPQLFVSREAFQWYTTGGNRFFCFRETPKIGISVSCFGFDSEGWFDDERHSYLISIATDQEVKTALEAECVKRYGEDWKNAKIKANADGSKINNKLRFNVGIYIELNQIFNRNGLIFDNGVWAEKLESNPIDEAIEQYKKDFETFLTKIRK